MGVWRPKTRLNTLLIEDRHFVSFLKWDEIKALKRGGSQWHDHHEAIHLQGASYQVLPVCKWVHLIRRLHSLIWGGGDEKQDEKSRESKSESPESVVRCVLFQLHWALRRPDWVLAKRLFISFPLYSFHLLAAAARPHSPSHPPSELRPGATWASLYCATGKLPIQGDTLIEHWKQEFHKEADLLFITSCLLLFFPTLSCYFFCSRCLARAPLPGLFPPAVSPSPLGVSHGAAFLPWRQYYVGDSNVMANTVITSWFTRGSALPGSIICPRSWGAQERPRALQEITPHYNIANLRNDREAITEKMSRFREEQLQSEDQRRSTAIKEFRERLWV